MMASLRSDTLAGILWTGWPVSHGITGRNHVDWPAGFGGIRMLSRKAGSFGEPWRSFYDPDVLITDLESIGFAHAEDTGPEAINARFFEDRSDRLMVGSLVHLMRAQR